MKFSLRILAILSSLIVSFQASHSQWIQTNFHLSKTIGMAVSGTHIYAATGLGVYVSVDSGVNWATSMDGILVDTSVTAFALVDTTLYAGTNNTIYRSDDNGSSWTEIHNGLTTYYVQALAGTPGPSGSIYAGTRSAVYRSTDYGTNWSAVTSPPQPDVRALAISGPNLLAGTWYGPVYRSTDEGASWVSIDSTWLNYIHVFHVTGSTVYAGGDSGVSVSYDNGASWTRLKDHVHPDEVIRGITTTSTNLFACSDFGITTSTNSGVDWTRENDGLSSDIFGQFPIHSLTTDGDHVLAGGYAVWRRLVNQLVAPTLEAPLNGVINQPTTVTFTWHRIYGGEQYHLQVATDSLFANIVFTDSALVDTFAQVTPLSNYIQYFWRVSAINLSGESAYSEVRRFRTLIAPPLNLAATGGNKRIALTWTPGSGGALRYRIYRGDGSPSFTLRDSIIADSITYRDTVLTNGVTYYYQTTAVDSQMFESGFSNVASASPNNQSPHAAALRDSNLTHAGRIPTTQLTFSSAGSHDPDGTIDSVYWYVEDSLVGRQTDLTHLFGPGSTKVTLIVEDNDHARDTSTATVTRSVFRLATSGSGYVGLTLLGDSILYAVSAGDALYRLDINGNTLYTLGVGGSVLSTSSVSYDTTVYIASTDKNLYAFSKFGVPIWPALPLGGVLSATAAVDSIGNRLYIGVQNRNFFAVNRTTGLVAWSYFSDAPIVNSAVVTSDRKLVFSTQAGTVYGFDLANLPGPVSPAWTLSLGDTITSSPAIDADGFFYVGTKSGKVAKISMQQGSQASTVWQAQTGGTVVASPVIDGNGTLYVGSLDSKLYAINTADGNIKWSLLSKGPIRSTAALSNSGIVYFGNDAGQLSAVDSAGNLIWKYLHPSAISSPLLYNKGTLYAAGEDAVVLAFFDGEDPFSQAPRAGANRQSAGIAGTKVPFWGTFQGNNQRTGAQSSQTGTGVSTKPVSIPKSFSLSQNYPNPFNPTTVIRFDVPGSSQVVLKVYSLLGQEVATLVNERKSAGSYEIAFDAGSRLASGLYFYRIQAGNFTDTKKFLLIK